MQPVNHISSPIFSKCEYLLIVEGQNYVFQFDFLWKDRESVTFLFPVLCTELEARKKVLQFEEYFCLVYFKLQIQI